MYDPLMFLLDNTPYVVEPYSPPTGQPDDKGGKDGKDADGTGGSTKASGEDVGGAGRGPGLLGWLPLVVLTGFCVVLFLKEFAGGRRGADNTEGS